MKYFIMDSEESNDTIKVIGFIIAGITAAFLIISEIIGISRSVHNSITEVCLGFLAPRRRPRNPDVESDTTV